MIQYNPGHQVTVIKLSPLGEEKIRYIGHVVEHLASRLVLLANWALPMRDLGYTCFEPQDQFREYYYTDRWFNIFSITSAIGRHKGWYCNIAEPVQLDKDSIRQVDLLLDVWVNPDGEVLLLDEEEFANATVTALSERQQTGAKQGLCMLLQMLERRQEAFSSLAYL